MNAVRSALAAGVLLLLVSGQAGAFCPECGKGAGPTVGERVTYLPDVADGGGPTYFVCDPYERQRLQFQYGGYGNGYGGGYGFAPQQYGSSNFSFDFDRNRILNRGDHVHLRLQNGGWSPPIYTGGGYGGGYPGPFASGGGNGGSPYLYGRNPN